MAKFPGFPWTCPQLSTVFYPLPFSPCRTRWNSKNKDYYFKFLGSCPQYIPFNKFLLWRPIGHASTTNVLVILKLKCLEWNFNSYLKVIQKHSRQFFYNLWSIVTPKSSLYLHFVIALLINIIIPTIQNFPNSITEKCLRFFHKFTIDDTHFRSFLSKLVSSFDPDTQIDLHRILKKYCGQKAFEM